MEFITVEQLNQIAVITLNRPDKRNAMHAAMIKELSSALRSLSQLDTLRILIIQANGEHFCAGADIVWMQHMITQSVSENEADAQLLADFMYELYIFPVPTIALVQGATRGGGLGIVAACDIAIAAHHTTFAFSEVKLGIAPSTISPYVVAAMGARQAQYYFLSGEIFEAEKAQTLGLIHQIVDAESLYNVGLELANTLIKNSPQAQREIKQLLRFVTPPVSVELRYKTAEHFAHLRVSKEAQEGLSAFLEKREARW